MTHQPEKKHSANAAAVLRNGILSLPTILAMLFGSLLSCTDITAPSAPATRADAMRARILACAQPCTATGEDYVIVVR